MLDPYRDAQERMTDGLYPGSLMIGDPGFHRFTQIEVDRAEQWYTTGSSAPLTAESLELADFFGYLPE